MDGEAITRRYTLGTLDTKRWNRASILTQGGTGNGRLTVEAVTSDPEQPEARLIEDQMVSESEDYNLRGRIGRRGYGLQLKFKTNTAKVRACTVEAIIQSRSNTDRS